MEGEDEPPSSSLLYRLGLCMLGVQIIYKNKQWREERVGGKRNFGGPEMRWRWLRGPETKIKARLINRKIRKDLKLTRPAVPKKARPRVVTWVLPLLCNYTSHVTNSSHSTALPDFDEESAKVELSVFNPEEFPDLKKFFFYVNITV